jgi:amicyanin
MRIATARRGALALLLAALVLFALGSIEIARGASHAVTISDFAFTPATLTVTAGDTVTWTNDDPIVHTATSTTGAFDSGDLVQKASYSVTFTTPGTYEYLCTPHPTMTGRIVVEAAAAAPTPAGGPLPDVAMRLELPRTTAFLTGLLLVGAAGLVVLSRRPRA